MSNNTSTVMNTPVLRRLKKSSSTVSMAPTFRVVVLGQSGVGKTAISVRFVTKRFIGEYDPTLENIYQHTCVVGATTVMFEIMDTAGQEENNTMMEEKMRWADAFLLVYAINDQLSFDEIPRLKFLIAHSMSQSHHQHKQSQPDPVVAIVGNKNDLEPDRMVERADGESLAQNLGCQFFEISVRDGFNDVISLFEETYFEYKRRIHITYEGHLKRKEKSFKYVDRIPRMQGNKRSYVLNDVINSDLMMSKIDECSKELEGSTTNKHKLLHRAQSCRNPVTSDVTTDSLMRKPEVRARRNAVVAFGNINTAAVSNKNLLHNNILDDVIIKPRRGRLTRSTRFSESAIEDDEINARQIPRHHSIMSSNYDANNNHKRDTYHCQAHDSANEMNNNNN